MAGACITRVARGTGAAAVDAVCHAPDPDPVALAGTQPLPFTTPVPVADWLPPRFRRLSIESCGLALLPYEKNTTPLSRRVSSPWVEFPVPAGQRPGGAPSDSPARGPRGSSATASAPTAPAGRT